MVNQIQVRWPDYVFSKSNSRGNIYSLILPAEYAGEQNLALLTNLPELSSLKIFASRRLKVPTITGISMLTNLPHLDILSVDCGQELERGVLEQICTIKTLRSLTLNAATPRAQEYVYLTNLMNLQELAMYGVSNFGDAEFNKLSRLPQLRRLVLSGDHLTSGWSNIVENFPALTNVVIWKNGKDVRWDRKR